MTPRAMRRPRTRHGFALTEAVVAGTLLLLLVQVGWWVAAVQGAVAARVVTGAQILDETRLIQHVLGTEIAYGQPGVDWNVRGNELHLRAFRGVAVGCAAQTSNGWAVAVAGYRSPDADKDSVLVLSEDGHWSVAALAGSSRRNTPECHDVAGFATEVWQLDPPADRALLGMYFERGAYRFSDGAFRYRRGVAWQPLPGTGIAIDSAAISVAADGGVTTRMTWEGSSPIRPSFHWNNWGRR